MDEKGRMKSRGQRPYFKIEEYVGGCHTCNEKIFYKDFIVVPIARNESVMHVVPLDILECPYCGTPMGIIEIVGTHLSGITTVPLIPPKNKGMN